MDDFYSHRHFLSISSWTEVPDRFYILTFHRRDTILWDFIPKGILEERINRNGKILKTDCRFIDLPEGRRICVGRGEKYRAARKGTVVYFVRLRWEHRTRTVC